ncbi:MAG: preprotein translocase subunit SecE [Clostridia bacterium]|nr:preprotein translocase subunit SecE [Clostridia bacterium]
MPNKTDTEKVKKGSFFSNMRKELSKVTWPTAKQTAKSTATTIAFVLLVTAILVVLNMAFQWLNGQYWAFIK